MKKAAYKVLSIVISVVLFALLLLFLVSGDNFDLLKSLFAEEHTKEELRDKLASFGMRGYVTIALLSMLQVIMAVLPAEPVQVLSGITFGFPIGLACCMAGVFLGNTIIFFLYKRFGARLNGYFDRKVKFDISKLSCSNRALLAILVLYFLPAIPYGMIAFIASTMRLKYPRFITVTLLGSLPSVCIGVALGHVAIATSWILSLAIFLVLALLVALMMIFRNRLFAIIDKVMTKEKKNKRTEVKLYKPSSLIIPHFISAAIIRLGGVKVKYKTNVEKLECPAIVLCNHGSFIDFVYAGTILRKYSPNFPVARLYFYKNASSALLRAYGCFPKSMFALDIESVRNCVKVVRSGGVLAMMPEARLSTAGEFEDIQPSTYSFIKKMAVPVYTVKISGDYFAKPKWGKGLRRGALVETELDLLISKEELEQMNDQQICERVENALRFNEFEWLKTHPELKYRSRKIAEGLENVLHLCPKCGAYHSLVSKGRTLTCEKCGLTAEIDERYGFKDSIPFENHLEWFRWQKERFTERIKSDPEFALTSHVVLKHSSLDGKTSLREVGDGVCTLDRSGLTYTGTADGEQIVKHFPLNDIYRLLFGAGEDFEIYEGKEIYFFVPDEKRSCIDWYMASDILKN